MSDQKAPVRLFSFSAELKVGDRVWVDRDGAHIGAPRAVNEKRVAAALRAGEEHQ